MGRSRAPCARDVGLLAEDDDGAIGFVFATLGKRNPRLAHVTDLYVRPRARGKGVARRLLGEVVDRAAQHGLEHLSLDVSLHNTGARAVYERLGFTPVSQWMVVESRVLATRLDAAPRGPSFGSIHVQTDDMPAVERAVRQFVPRLPGGSRGSVVAPPRNGWIAIYDELCDRDPRQLRRLARELSDRLGSVALSLGVEHGEVVRFVLFDRGREMDEYLSVQEYYGPLPPGDVVALAANPTVVARLTGADPATVRAAALHAASPRDLPPPDEVLARLGGAIGIGEVARGYGAATGLPDALVLPRS